MLIAPSFSHARFQYRYINQISKEGGFLLNYGKLFEIHNDCKITERGSLE